MPPPHAHTTVNTNTIYVPVVSPPTPAPSPGPIEVSHLFPPSSPSSSSSSSTSDNFDTHSPPPSPPTQVAPLKPGLGIDTTALTLTSPSTRLELLSSLITACTPQELLYISSLIAPRLKRDFLSDLPTGAGAACPGGVCRRWGVLCREEGVWRGLGGRGGCDARTTDERGGEAEYTTTPSPTTSEDPLEEMEEAKVALLGDSDLDDECPGTCSYREYFKACYITTPAPVVTSLALSASWAVVGLANSRIQVYSARTGVLAKTLVGHELGVWSVGLVGRGGWLAEPSCRSGDAGCQGGGYGGGGYGGCGEYRGEGGEGTGKKSKEGRPQAKRRYSDMCYSSVGWGQPNAIVVSGGCDKVVMVWDVKTGQCIYRLSGHTSTIRCIRVLDNRPSRVWDIQRGRCVRVLRGHEQSVRTLDCEGSRVVSGSYDATVRVWDVDTGECIHVLQGHYHQIYSVAFDGRYIASGGLDTTVRLWDVETGKCLALLQGHTALVCQLQLSPNLLITGGSDGRVITFDLETLSIKQRIAAHDCSVTGLQHDDFVVTSGNDGRVRLYEVDAGDYVRDLSDGAESVWKVVCGWGKCVVVCKRAGKTVVEVWSMGPTQPESTGVESIHLTTLGDPRNKAAK
ncbi:WD40 repeat-like protein [Coprinellus micaceus]|uniref:WD40 repeat-like protein n=1 Tax=Coprinellus micaceus TaxID=71717 RepID=A0A4Y7SJR6_COPMI|nr:WD40 repeat-like protein [Coprinellus micaceus]